MHERLVRLLTVNRPQLVEEIELEREPGILNLLLSYNVFNKRQAKSISCLADPYKQTEALIEALYRRPDVDFFRFCDALVATGQSHIVDAYLKSTADLQNELNDSSRADCRVGTHTERVQGGDGRKESQVTTLQDNDSDDVANITRSGVLHQCCDVAMCDNNPSHAATFSPSTILVNNGPIVINEVIVQPTNPEFYRQNRSKSYEMWKQPRGLCIIFNVEEARGLPERRGSQLDTALLTSLFTQLHFEIRHYNNLSSADMMHIVVALSQDGDKLEACQCLVLVVMSHGATLYSPPLPPQHCLSPPAAAVCHRGPCQESGEAAPFLYGLGSEREEKAEHVSMQLQQGEAQQMSVQPGEEVVYGADGLSVSTRQLLDPLTNQRCPYLRAKPRLVLFQACRGEEYDDGVDHEGGMTREANERETLVASDTQNASERAEQAANEGGEQGANERALHKTSERRVRRANEAGMQEVGEEGVEGAIEENVVRVVGERGTQRHVDISDFIIGFPTQAGFRSFRNPDTGSWYINAVVQVFMAHACNMDVTAMLRKVNGMVSTWFPRTTDPEMSGRGQAAQLLDYLKKDYLHFFPGIMHSSN